ncbi:hypothetical protein AB7X32_22420 [Morganella morganii]|uniref:hypothetical protein n=1 Tax=Morganella morganii TaxID=582 RepID=UPI0034E5B2B3
MEADWLLADDYTSALVISSNQLFGKMIIGPTEITLGYGIHLARYSDGTDKACQLKATSGIIFNNFETDIHYPGDSNKVYRHFGTVIYADLYDNKTSEVSLPFTIGSSYHRDDKFDIYAEYKFDGIIGTKSENVDIKAAGYSYKYDGLGNQQYPAIHTTGYYSLHLYFNSMYKAVIENDVIYFVYSPDGSSYSISMDNNVCSSGCDLFPTREIDGIMETYKSEVKDEIIDKMEVSAVRIKLKDVNTFTLRNLLFPDNNYFRVQHARVPGDLLVMGKLGAGSESFAITPTETTLVAGSGYQFTTAPEVSGVKWSLSDSEKGNINADLGHIDAATGKYTAPQAAAVTEGVRHVVVCAEKGDTKVYALASVLAHSVNISPAYQVILPGKSSALTAQSLNGGELTWTLADNPQGSALTKVSNNEYTYTAGKKNKKLKLNLERVSVTDETGTTTEAMILVRNVLLTGYIRVSYDNVPENSVQLTYFSDPEDPETAMPADEVEWTLLESGGATLDTETGILSCKQATDNGFAVISTKYLDEDEGALHCAIAIPLPLNTYKETILSAYSPEQV